MSTASALLAIRSALFVVSALLHGARALLDLLPRRRRVVSRASTFWASVGLVFSAAAFALGHYRDRSSRAAVAAGFVAPAALWAFKVSVVSLYPQLGLRLLVVGALGGYLAASFLSVLLMRLFVCRPWADWDKEYCGLTAAVVAYSVLNVSSYILVISIPLCIWRALTQKRPVAVLLVLSAGTVLVSIVYALATLGVVAAGDDTHALSGVLADTELALALTLTALPSLYLHVRYRKMPPPPPPPPPPPLSQPAPVSPGEERELVTLGTGNGGFDPRHLGVLPDSIHAGSFRSSAESSDASRGAFRAARGIRKHGDIGSREEVWEMDGNMPASPRSMGGS